MKESRDALREAKRLYAEAGARIIAAVKPCLPLDQDQQFTVIVRHGHIKVHFGPPSHKETGYTE